MRCSVFIATSLDGFVARTDGRIDWLSLVERPGEDYGYGVFFESVDAVVVGRKTYETALGFPTWPYDRKRCVVVTHETDRRPRYGEEFSAAAPQELVARLTAAGVQRIYVDGPTVIQSFLAAGVVTDMTISIVPVLLGEGVPLFGSKRADVRFEPLGSRTFESGLVQLEYRVR